MLEGDCKSSFTLKIIQNAQNIMFAGPSLGAPAATPVIVALDSSKPQGPCALLA